MSEPLFPHYPVEAAQLRLLRLVAAGMTQTEAAAETGWSKKVVERELAALKIALGAKNLAHAVAIAFREGFLS